MKLFDDDGHLNKQSFLLLQDDGGDDLQRLEISEHLSFCDDCLSRYLDNISRTVLLSPVSPMAETIKQNGRRLAISLFYRRFTVVAATFMAMFLWTAGAFTWDHRLIEREIANKISTEAGFISKEANYLSTIIFDKFSDIFDQAQQWGSNEKIIKDKE